MVQVVSPLGIEAVAVGFPRRNQPGVVQFALGYENKVLSQLGGKEVHFAGQVLQEVKGGGVNKGMNGIQAQAVEVVIAKPHKRVIDEEFAYLMASLPVEVDRISPVSFVLIG